MGGPKLPVNIDTTYPDVKADPSIKAHQQAHDALHRIANTFDTALGTATAGQVLTWNGTVYAPAAVPRGGGPSLKSLEDASRAIYALSPSPETGLTAVAADAGTDDAPRLQAMLDYLKKTYGGGQLILPPGRTSNCNSTITIPAGVQVIGSATSVWDFWYAGSAATAVVVNDKECTPIIGLKIHGNQWDANRTSHNTTTSTGLRVSGYTLNFVDVHVSGFNWGVDFTNDNTYLVSFERSTIDGCMVAINIDLDNTWTGGSGSVSNSGERMAFTDCVIANCDTVYWATGNGVGLFFTHTSMDFCTTWGRQRNAHVFFQGCHLESTYSGRNRYLFDLDVNSRLYMVNCLFILGTPGIYYAINPASAPWNLGWGIAHFTSCGVSYNPTPAAQGDGAVSTGYSESLVPVPTGAAKVVVASFFVSKWNAMKVNVVAAGGPAADVTARISAISTANATVTVTLSAPAPAGTWLEVQF
ncbi:hypothetical protein [uncultured Friedmanniella sp.]|uniref:hypothetical protein n=1 Tax=uncultured Friedmanniella sp. TaxID=335381 RepID=UPI0035CA156F